MQRLSLTVLERLCKTSKQTTNTALPTKSVVNIWQHILNSALLSLALSLKHEFVYFLLCTRLDDMYIYTFEVLSSCSTDPETDIFAAFTYEQLNLW